MSELPKIAQDRLIKSYPGPHPEADLLAAFAEQSLAAAERERVMAHLAACADCREVVHLALPPLEEPQKVFSGSPQSKIFGWSRMRWGALAAGMAAVVTVVVLTQDSGDRSVARTPKAEDEKTLLAESRKPAPPAQEPAAKVSADKVQSAGGSGAKADAAAPPPAKVAEQEQAFAAPTANQTQVAQAQNALDHGNYGYASMPQQTGTVAPTNAQQPKQVQSMNGAGRVESDALSAPAAGQIALADAVKPAAPTAATVAQRRAGSDLKKEAAKDQSAAASSESVAAFTPLANMPVSGAEAKNLRMLSGKSGVASAATARSSDGGVWRISGGALQLIGGTPQHDRDDAESNKKAKITGSPELAEAWRQIKTARDVPLNAIWVIGTNIWVGGENGSLQHSADNGKTWAEIHGPWPPNAEIVSVRFRDASHGEIKTSAGERWTTDDAGATWYTQT